MNALLDYFGPAAKPVIQVLMNSLWQGLLLTAIVWLLLRAMRRTNAATRFAVWWAVLIAVAFLPLLNERLITARPPASESASDHQSISRKSTSTAQPASAPQHPEESTEVLSLSTPALSASDVSDESRNVSLVIPIRFLNERGAVILFSMWLLGALVMLGRLLRGYFHLRWLKRGMSPLPQNRQERPALCCLDSLKRQVGLGASSRITTPLAAGFTKPTILIPESLVDELTESEFDQIVLHELAHIRRLDDWLNLAQKLIEAILFFNPAVWWIGRQLNLEREIACDDRVVSLTGKSKPYAACLLKLAEIARLRRITMLAPGAVSAGNQISRRIEILMDKKRNSTVRLSRAMFLTAITLLSIAVVKGTQILPTLALDESSASSITSPDQAVSDQPTSQSGAPAPQYAASNSASKAAEVQSASPSSGSRGQEVKGLIPPEPPLLPQYEPLHPTNVPYLPPMKALPPFPPIQAWEKDPTRYEEEKRKYKEKIRQYAQEMVEYDKQIEQELQRYEQETVEYDRQMKIYEEKMRRYREEMKLYEEKMRKFEQQIYEMVPPVVRRLIDEEVSKIDAAMRDRLSPAMEQVSSSIARELISKVRDLKINRPGGYIALVSELTKKEIQEKLSNHFRKHDLKLDARVKEELDAALGRAASSLQWLIVYRFNQ